jgi:iron complex outermembrane receptor protein
MQEVAQVEVLTGLSGFLYGAGNIGGMVNYVTKRPTEERLNSVTVGNTSGSNVYLHGDFGGQIDQEGKFGYRFNVLTQNGETATKNQDLELNFVSFAFDWRVSDSLLIQLDGSDRDYHMKGLQTGWSLGDDEHGDKAIRPSAARLDSDKLWSQKWAVQDSQNQRLATNLFWDINENLSLRAGYLTDTTSRYYTFADSTINADDTYTQYAETDKSAPSRKAYTWGSFIFIDMGFNTGDITHKIVTGLRFSDKERNDGNNAWSNGVELGPFSLTNPSYVDEPNWQYDGEYSPYLQSKTTTSNISIGDDIIFNEQWSALVGLAYSTIEDKRYNGDTTLRTYYDESALTPSLSIIYKPIDSVTTYASYMEGLEAGDHADDRHQGREVINAGESFKPLTSTQLELGAKADISGILFAAALFEIEKPIEYYLLKGDKFEFVQDGSQLHRGLEFTATGKLTENLTIVGGFTLLDAKVKEQRAEPELEGNRPDEVAKQMFKFYAEYAISAISGLVINGSLSHTGSFYSELDNKEELDGYTLTDIGARYTFNNLTNPVTLRFNVSNLTDKRYWANSSYTGDGRRMALSANIAF